MPLSLALGYVKTMEVIEAKETLTAITVNEFSHNMKQQDRKRTHRNLRKMAERYDKIEAKSMDDLEAIMKGLMGG